MKTKKTPRSRRTKGADLPTAVRLAPRHGADEQVVHSAPSAGGVPSDADGQWVRLPKASQTLRGLSRSFLFRLCAAGMVKSIVIPGPLPAGASDTKRKTRGVRLLLIASLDEFLATRLAAATGENDAQ